jgi:hypothetical protein
MSVLSAAMVTHPRAEAKAAAVVLRAPDRVGPVAIVWATRIVGRAGESVGGG